MKNSHWDQHVIVMLEQGVNEEIVAPLLHRIAWFFGCKIPPPLLASFKTNACFMGCYFGLALALAMSAMTIVKAGHINPLLVFLIVFPLSGLPFGLIMASYYSFKASSLGLLKALD